MVEGRPSATVFRGTRFLERKLCKELYTVVAGFFSLYGLVKGGFWMGLCVAI